MPACVRVHRAPDRRAWHFARESSTRIFGDVHHARDAKNAPVRIDDGRRVVGVFTAALEQIQHHDDTEVPRLLAKGTHQWPIEWFGERLDVAVRGTLRMKPPERKLGVAGELRTWPAAVSRLARPRAMFACLCAPPLLDERDLHRSFWCGTAR